MPSGAKSPGDTSPSKSSSTKAAGKQPSTSSKQVKAPDVRQPLTVTTLASIGVPMKLDNTRFADVDLSQKPSKKFTSPPNQLLPVGDLLWLQDSAHDSFSHGESLWSTLAEIVLGKTNIYKSRTAPLGLPTIRVVKLENKFYAVDTRRPLIYKVAFDPKQLIPVQVIPPSQEAMDKWHSSRIGNKDSGCTVLLQTRLHDAVPDGFAQLSFVRDITSLPKTTPSTASGDGDNCESRNHPALDESGQHPSGDDLQAVVDQPPRRLWADVESEDDDLIVSNVSDGGITDVSSTRVGSEASDDDSYRPPTISSTPQRCPLMCFKSW